MGQGGDRGWVASKSRISASKASVLVETGAGGASFRTSRDMAFTTQKTAKEMITKLIIVLIKTPMFTVGAAASRRTLPFHNAVWHGFVLVAASSHYAAILHGVVLARS